MRGLVFALSLAAGLGCTTAARSQDIIKVADPEVVLDVAKGFGSASLDKDSSGDPMISGRLQGVKYSIWFYGCKEAKSCRSIQFSTGYTDEFGIEKANEWNTKFRWVKAYAGDGSNFKMDVDFYGGVTREFIEAQFSTWDSLISDIKNFVREE